MIHEFLTAQGVDTPVLFVSDPANGDKFVLGSGLAGYRIPHTAESHELTTIGDLLARLDFAAYEGQPVNHLVDFVH